MTEDTRSSPFNYAAPDAQLFTPGRGRQHRIDYRRFDTASEAIRFAIEKLDDKFLSGAILEIEGSRYGASEIGKLYADESYPLGRIPPDSTKATNIFAPSATCGDQP
jgi:hypothetical protein